MKFRKTLSGALLAATINFAGGAAMASPAVITISESGGAPISHYLYGVNYDWNEVPEAEFGNFATAISQVAHVTLVRYPGGWNAENYNWMRNTESGKKAPASPGVPPATLLGAVPMASFITPSEKAISNPEKINHFVKLTAQLVAQYGGAVPVWEIGNEWWLQSGARQSREKCLQNLQNYAELLAAVVPAIKAENPSVKVFATVDWTQPDDIATLRQLTGPAWSQIDGISVHSYCGTTDPDHLCGDLPAKLALVRASAGKQLLYASEWAVAKQMSGDDYGIKNANYTIAALQDLAFAGVTYAAYWPPIKELPALAFVSADYGTPFATGIAFGWMSQYYEGTALRASGPLPALAARDGISTTVIVASEDTRTQTVQIDLAGTGLTKVISAQVMSSAQPDDPQASRLVNIASLPTAMTTGADGSPCVQFIVNPGTPGRGSEYEIVRVTLG